MTKPTPEESKKFIDDLNKSLKDIEEMIVFCRTNPAMFPVVIFGELKKARNNLKEAIKSFKDE